MKTVRNGSTEERDCYTRKIQTTGPFNLTCVMENAEENDVNSENLLS